MKKQNTILVSLFLLSCTPLNEEQPDQKSNQRTSKEALIINRLDIVQGGVSQINSSESTNDDDIEFNYRRMNLSESTVRITSDQFDENGCGTPFPSFNPDVHGSGILTSSTRVTTAHHVVHGAVGYKSFTLPPITQNTSNHYAVRFGSGDTSARLNYKAGLKYENPLLAKRLFALGLDNWSKTSASDTRKRLRQWIYNFDEEDRAQEFVTEVSSNPKTLKGIDFAVIKPKDDLHPLSYNQDLSSGKFDFDSPGPFFSIVPTAPFDGEVNQCPGDNETMLYSAMFHLYPEGATQDPKEHYMPISGEGYQDSIGKRSDCAQGPKCTGEMSTTTFSSELVVMDYDDCFYTTLDAIPGCSGGGVLESSCDYEGDNQYNPNNRVMQDLKATGVISFVFNNSSSEGTSWLSSPQVEDFDEPGNDDLKNESFTGVTLFNETTTKWSNRDKNFQIDGTPFSPLPNQPVDDGCPGDANGFACEVKVEPSESTGYSSPEISLTYVINKKKDSSGNDFPGVVNGDPNTEYSDIGEENENFDQLLAENDFEFVGCFDRYGPTVEIAPDEISSRTWLLNFAMAQGFSGSTNNVTLDPSDNSLRVSALSPICVPWSSAPWSSNWSWSRLFKDTLSNFNAASPILGVHSVAGSYVKLSRFLFYVLEKRITLNSEREFVTSIHPPSMKNCPPNYYLKGMRYLKTSSELDQGEVVGITDLICQSHLDPYEDSEGTLPKTIEVPLHADKNDFSYKFYSLNMLQPDVNYDISATIGVNQNLTWTHQTYDSCDDGQGVVGYVIRRDDTSSNINYIHLYCANAPKGGTQ